MKKILSLLLLIILTFTCCKDNENSNFDAKKWTNNYFKVWNDKQLDKVKDFYTEDIVYKDLNLGTKTIGRQELMKFMNENFKNYQDLHFKTIETINQGDTILSVRWLMTGTFEKTKFATEGVSIMHLRNYKVYDNTDFYK